LADRRIDAIALGQRAAALAQEHGRFDVACEALLLVGYASRRHQDTDMARRALSQALSLSEEYRLSVWQVRTLAELGMLDLDADSDPTRLYQARERATAAGMVGMVAAINVRIGETILTRNGPVATYSTFLAADTQARQLQLVGLYAHTRVHIAECLLNADDRPLPGRARPAPPSEVDDLIVEALALGEKSKPIPWAKQPLAMRAWFHGDNPSAIELFDESLRSLHGEVHIVAPMLYTAGVEAALGWLHEADAFCSAAGERALQRRIRYDLRTIGAKVPKASTATVPPHLARYGITARETEVLRLINAGLSNADISHRLFISTRTVESHVSSMLQKTGQASREQLPSVSRAED
jgi:DNA-binding CsgD family transcriptional regulator